MAQACYTQQNQQMWMASAQQQTGGEWEGSSWGCGQPSEWAANQNMWQQMQGQQLPDQHHAQQWHEQQLMQGQRGMMQPMMQQAMLPVLLPSTQPNQQPQATGQQMPLVLPSSAHHMQQMHSQPQQLNNQRPAQGGQRQQPYNPAMPVMQTQPAIDGQVIMNLMMQQAGGQGRHFSQMQQEGKHIQAPDAKSALAPPHFKAAETFKPAPRQSSQQGAEAYPQKNGRDLAAGQSANPVANNGWVYFATPQGRGGPAKKAADGTSGPAFYGRADRGDHGPRGDRDHGNRGSMNDTASNLARRRRRQRVGPAFAPFGNPAAASAAAERATQLTAQLEEGGEAMARAITALRGNIRRLSFESAGCRVVQLAMKVADCHEGASLAAELKGHVRDAIASPHANYVIQKVVEALPAALCSFVAEELMGQGAAVARHCYGCRILCRLLEQSASEASTAKLMDEVLLDAPELVRHSFGHHVIQSVLENGLPEQRRKVASALGNNIMANARNRNASYVLEKALTYCCPEDQRVLASGLLANPDSIVSLAQSQFGGYVVRSLAALRDRNGEKALQYLRHCAPQLLETKHGRRLLEDLKLVDERSSGITSLAAPAA